MSLDCAQRFERGVMQAVRAGRPGGRVILYTRFDLLGFQIDTLVFRLLARLCDPAARHEQQIARLEQ
jgi:hypothetical protein